MWFAPVLTSGTGVAVEGWLKSVQVHGIGQQSRSWRDRVQCVAGVGHSLEEGLTPACRPVGTAPGQWTSKRDRDMSQLLFWSCHGTWPSFFAGPAMGGGRARDVP